jgi:hypothetical protein
LIVELLMASVVFYCFGMGSLIDELRRRGAAARAERRNCAGGSRSWLSVWPGSRGRLSRLVIARETVDEVLSDAAALAYGDPPS